MKRRATTIADAVGDALHAARREYMALLADVVNDQDALENAANNGDFFTIKRLHDKWTAGQHMITKNNPKDDA